jgi:serine/threonine-protein kinase
MDPDHWRRIEELFHAALELAPAERAAFLDQHCAGDAALARHVERLLAADASPSGPLDDPNLPIAELRNDPWIGREIGVYRLTERIAAGGMGIVYRARRTDGLFEHEVAIKLIRAGAASEELLRRFDLERRTLATLSHPNIARLYDGGTTDEGSPYLVMELIEGTRIDRYCDEHRLSIAQRTRLFTTICRAVHFAHQNLVVHRDLKPGNILIDREGVPKLLDFGIARLIGSEADGPGREPTRTLGRILTPEYASPEQLAGAPVTTATDVYSLGVVLYGLLTGRKPFRCESRSPADWERLVSLREPTRPSSAIFRAETTSAGDPEPSPVEFAARCGTSPARLRARLAGDLDRIVLMALRKEPERRYASAQELAEDLGRQLEGKPVAARPNSLVYVTGRFVRRNRIAVGAAVSILLALVFGIAAARRGERREREQAVHARIEADSSREMAQILMDTFLTSDAFETEERRDLALESILAQANRVRRQYAVDDHLRANLLDSLGRVCFLLDRYDPAAKLLQEAYEQREREFGSHSLEVALSLGNMGELAYRRGEFSAAAGLLRQALELHRTCPIGTHTDVARAANDLGAALRNLGELDEAESLHREALALRRAAGDGSLPVAESLNNLAGIHLDRGEYEPARELLQEALEIRRSILGDRSSLVLQSASNLAIPTWQLGERGTARTLLEDAATGYRALHADGRDGLGRVLSSLAACNLTENRLEEAEANLGEALDIQLSRVGPDHPLVASVLASMADLHHRQGKNEEAGEDWLEALRIRRGAFPAPHPTLARTLWEYGAFLTETGKLEEAHAALCEAVTMSRALPTPDPALLRSAELALGTCLLRLHRPDEAESHLREGERMLESDRGDRGG